MDNKTFDNTEICNRKSKLGCYDCYVGVYDNPNNRTFNVDGCLWKEIMWLNENGVITENCCCNHHIDSKTNTPEIIVSKESEKQMNRLGYDGYINKNNVMIFFAKTKIKNEA